MSALSFHATKLTANWGRTDPTIAAIASDRNRRIPVIGPPVRYRPDQGRLGIATNWCCCCRRDIQRAGAPLLRMEIVERSDDMNGLVGLPSPAGQEHFLLVRAKSPPRQELREPCRDPRDLGYPRCHPARHQAAHQNERFESGSDSCQLPEHTPQYRRGCRKRYSGRTARALTTKGGSNHGELQGHIVGQSRV